MSEPAANASEFDGFLCHHWADKKEIRSIAHTFEVNGIKPCLSVGHEWASLRLTLSLPLPLSIAYVTIVKNRLSKCMASLHESCPEWTRSIHGQGGLSAIYGFAAIDRRSVQYVGFKNFVAENAIFAWSGIGP